VKRERGTGCVFKQRYKDAQGRQKETSTWYISYYVEEKGRHVKESTGKTSKAAAEKILRQRLSSLDKGEPTGPDVDRTTLGDLAAMIVDDYTANQRKSGRRIKECLAHLVGVDADPEKGTKAKAGFFLKTTKAKTVAEDRITAYVAHRQSDGAKNATINRELACLRRMFRLGAKARKVGRRPDVTLLKEHNRRKGFFEPADFYAVLAHLPSDLRPMAEVAYITGWRIASELLTRQWKDVDFSAGFLRLDPEETKTDDGRMFPFTPELRKVLEAQRAHTEAVEQEHDRIIPWVFHRDGDPIRTFRRAWISACIKAGLGKRITDTEGKILKRIAYRIPHDFRRTAVRNLERAGVPRSAAMAMVGHKTESVYRRYAITDEVMLKEAAVKLAALHEAQRAVAPAGKVAAGRFGKAK
jgi:integrase